MGPLRLPPLSLPQQMAALRVDWPEGKTRLTKTGLTWTGELSPSPLSRAYLTRVSYPSPQHLPTTRVLHPSLRALSEERVIPHLYCQQTGTLCLFTPTLHEWTPRQRLSRTILPWAHLWLFYFEDWLATDHWQGGGTDHPTPRTIASRQAPFLRSLR